MKLYPHQVNIKKFILAHPKCLIISPMGSGKTRACLDAIRVSMDSDTPMKALIIAPLRVAKLVWPEEASACGLDCVYISSKDKRNYKKSTNCIYSTNFENPNLHLPEGTNTLIIDESSKLKGFSFYQGAKRAKIIYNLARKCNHVILLTGTPCSESLGDLYSQISFIDSGATFGRSKYTFMQNFCDNVSRSPKYHIWKPKPNAYETIINRVGDFVKYFEPDITTFGQMLTDITIEVTPEQTKVIKGLKSNNIYNDVYACNAAVLASKLLHVCSGFSYTEDGHTQYYKSGKLEALKDILEDNPGERFIIVAYWKASIKAITDEIEDITTDIETFKAGKYKHLLINPASAAHGLSLQQQSRCMLFYEPFYSCEQYEQVKERCGERRQAQSGLNRTVYYYYFVCSPLERAAWSALKEKENVEQTIINYIKGV